MLYIIATIMILPVMIYAFWASFNVKKTFNLYSNVNSNSGMSAKDVARRVLDDAGLQSVSIKAVPGNLTDHYNPKDNTVYLSDSVYNSHSISAIGVATHEVGHAIQNNSNYLPIKIRMALVPYANIGSRLAIPLILISFFVGAGQFMGYMVGDIFAIAGLILYSLSTLFSLITLPVEFNASNRAKKILVETGILDEEEGAISAKVLNAAAQTYVASFALSLVYLIRIIAMVMLRRKR